MNSGGPIRFNGRSGGYQPPCQPKVRWIDQRQVEIDGKQVKVGDVKEGIVRHINEQHGVFVDIGLGRQGRLPMIEGIAVGQRIVVRITEFIRSRSKGVLIELEKIRSDQAAGRYETVMIAGRKVRIKLSMPKPEDAEAERLFTGSGGVKIWPKNNGPRMLMPDWLLLNKNLGMMQRQAVRVVRTGVISAVGCISYEVCVPEQFPSFVNPLREAIRDKKIFTAGTYDRLNREHPLVNVPLGQTALSIASKDPLQAGDARYFPNGMLVVPSEHDGLVIKVISKGKYEFSLRMREGDPPADDGEFIQAMARQGLVAVPKLYEVKDLLDALVEMGAYYQGNPVSSSVAKLWFSRPGMGGFDVRPWLLTESSRQNCIRVDKKPLIPLLDLGFLGYSGISGHCDRELIDCLPAILAAIVNKKVFTAKMEMNKSYVEELIVSSREPIEAGIDYLANGILGVQREKGDAIAETINQGNFKFRLALNEFTDKYDNPTIWDLLYAMARNPFTIVPV